MLYSWKYKKPHPSKKVGYCKIAERFITDGMVQPQQKYKIHSSVYSIWDM